MRLLRWKRVPIVYPGKHDMPWRMKTDKLEKYCAWVTAWVNYYCKTPEEEEHAASGAAPYFAELLLRRKLDDLP